MSSRDEQLEALEAAVKSAESKLKSAEISAEDISVKLKSSEEEFQRKIETKAAGYKAQSGVNFNRIVDENGKVSYEFTRDITPNERKQRRKLKLRRQFDTETGSSSIKAQFEDDDRQTVKVTSADDLKKPKNRKRFVAYKMFGYHKIDVDSNPFKKAVGAPIVVPLKTAAKLTEKLKESPVGNGISKTAKAVTTPIILPARIVKDIVDKGGIIHSVVDMGDKIKIEGFNVPKPIATAGNIAKSAALGAETAAIETTKGLRNFTIEIAKEKIYEELNKDISENEATKAAYVIGMKSFEVSKILGRHAKFRIAVLRDKAGDDITDVNVSRYLAYKEEEKFSKEQTKLLKEKGKADMDVQNALAEYESAKKRLEEYKAKKKTVPVAESKKPEITQAADILGTESKSRVNLRKPKKKVLPEEKVSDIAEITKSVKESKGKISLEKPKKSVLPNEKKTSKIDKKIEKTKDKVESLKKPDKKIHVADTKNTVLELNKLAVTTAVVGLRRKAMQDSDGNTGVEAVDGTVTAAKSAIHLGKTTAEKGRDWAEQYYKGKLLMLENQKKIESKVAESIGKKLKPKKALADLGKKSAKKSTEKQTKKALQKQFIKKMVQKKVYKETAKKAAKVGGGMAVKGGAAAATKLSGEAAVAAVGASSTNPVGWGILIGLLVIILIFLLYFLLIFLCIVLFSGGTATIYSQVRSPCSTNDLTLCDRYYTELASDMIYKHQHIDDYYTGYSRYDCLTTIDEISHSPEKLLPYLGAKIINDSGNEEWTFDDAKPYISDIFNEQYELYTNEIHEVRACVTDKKYTNEDDSYSELGTSEYSLNIPDGVDDFPEHLTSEGYTWYAHTENHIEILIMNGYITNTIEDVGEYTDIDGNTSVYRDKQDMTFNNYWYILLVFDWCTTHNRYEEYWYYAEYYQDVYWYDYYILEYAIQEKPISVDDSFWTETDERWRDVGFDKLIYNHVLELDDDYREQFGIYYNFLMGHQTLTLPFKDPVVKKYAGYNNVIDDDTSLDYGITLGTYAGQDIICGMDGKVTKINSSSFSIYNEDYGTLYYENVKIPDSSKVKQGEVISSSTSDTIRITFKDNDGNYLNPLFIFS